MMDNGLADDGAKRRHAVRQPLRHPAAVQGKVGAAAATGHRVLFRWVTMPSILEARFGFANRLRPDVRLEDSHHGTRVFGPVGSQQRSPRNRCHRSERDRIALRLDLGNTMLPDLPRGPRHLVDLSRQGFAGAALPLGLSLSPKTEFAGGAEREAENSLKLRLVAVPADSNADVVFRAEDLLDLGAWAAEPFDLSHYIEKPCRNRLGLREAPQRVVVAESKRSDPPFALILPELKGRQWQGGDLANKRLLDDLAPYR
jgi:hypothetical protein